MKNNPQTQIQQRNAEFAVLSAKAELQMAALHGHLLDSNRLQGYDTDEIEAFVGKANELLAKWQRTQAEISDLRLTYL